MATEVFPEMFGNAQEYRSYRLKLLLMSARHFGTDENSQEHEHERESMSARAAFVTAATSCETEATVFLVVRGPNVSPVGFDRFRKFAEKVCWLLNIQVIRPACPPLATERLTS